MQIIEKNNEYFVYMDLLNMSNYFLLIKKIFTN